MDARRLVTRLGIGSLLILGAATTAPLASMAQARMSAPLVAEVNPADFATAVDHPLFPLASMPPKVLVGQTTDPATGQITKERVELRVSPATEMVAGVEVTVLEEFGYIDGRLDEHSRDYFAQGKDGTVYLFGERVDHFQDGQLIEQPGTWLVGQDVPVPFVYLPAELSVGQTFKPEFVPGLAEDVAIVTALDQSVTTAAGTFDGCAVLTIQDLAGDVVDRSLCAGVGFVKEALAGDSAGVEDPATGEGPEGGVELVKLGA